MKSGIKMFLNENNYCEKTFFEKIFCCFNTINRKKLAFCDKKVYNRPIFVTD